MGVCDSEYLTQTSAGNRNIVEMCRRKEKSVTHTAQTVTRAGTFKPSAPIFWRMYRAQYH